MPTTLTPRWCTTGDVLEPAEGRKDSGFLDGDQPPAKVFNWLHRNALVVLHQLRLTSQIRGIAHQTPGGPVVADSNATAATARCILRAGDRLIAISDATISAVATVVISTSDDKGASWTDRYSVAGTVDSAGGAVEDGGWAVLMADGNEWYYAQAPFESWTRVTGGSGFSNTKYGARAVTLEGARFLALPRATGAGDTVYYIEADAEPVDGNWQSVRPGSDSEFGAAIDSGGGYTVLFAQNTSNTAAAFWCLDTEGAADVDWTQVDIGTASSLNGGAYDAFHERWSAIDNDGAVWYADDPTGAWTQGVIPEEADGDTVLKAHADGLIVAYHEGTADGDDIYASHDGGETFVLAVASADNGLRPAIEGADGHIEIDDEGTLFGFTNDTVARCVRTLGG